MWNHYSTVFFHVRKSHLCSEDTQRKCTSSCLSQEDQHSDCRWLPKHKTSSKHFVRHSITLREEVFLLQTWLLRGYLSLLAFGERTVSGKGCIHFCQRNLCLWGICPTSQQIRVCLFMFHAWVLGPICQSWPIGSIRERNCNKATDITRINREVFNWIRQAGLKLTKQVPLWSHVGWTFCQNDFTGKNFTASWKYWKLSWQTQIPKSKKAF